MRSAFFIREFLKHPKEVGTLSPSSQMLSKKMAQQVDGAAVVIEFGAGKGAVTSQILKRLPVNGRLMSFEINPGFCGYLEDINDSRLKIINDDAANCEQYIDNIDYIVSSLPLRLFEKTHRKKILDISSRAKKYIQLQYSPFLRKMLEYHFKVVRAKFVLFNFPPAFIYICESSMKCRGQAARFTPGSVEKKH